MLTDKWESVKTCLNISPNSFQDFSFHSHQLSIFQNVNGQNTFEHFTWFFSRFSFIHINLVFFQDVNGQNIFDHFTWFLSRFLPDLLRAPPPLAWVSPIWAWTSRSRRSSCWTECSGSPWLTQPGFNVKMVTLKSKISYTW